MSTAFQQFEDRAMHAMAQKKIVLDVGGGSRFMKGMKKYEPLFVNCDYKTFDVSADYHPDIVGDIHAIPCAEGSIDAIICRSVLEHVERPHVAVSEMYRVLSKDGLLFIQVPSIYPYHARKGFGGYPDYWRFFEDSLRLMLKDFSEVHLQKHGGWFQMLSYFMPLQARLRPILDPICDALDTLFQTERRTNTPFYSVLAKK